SSPRLYLTRRSFTSSSFFPAVSMRATSASGARVEGVPQPVADEVHGHDRQADADARRKAQIGIVADVQHVLRDDGAPLRRGRGHAQAEEAHGGDAEDDLPQGQRRGDDDGAYAVGQDVAQDDLRGAAAEAARG